MQLAKAALVQQRRMAPPFSPRLPLRTNPQEAREVHGGLSCEIDRTYARFRSLTTGTFNLVVKDRIAVRRSGANSVQANPHKCESDCPRNLTNILCFAKSCQPQHPTGFPDVFHIGNSPGRRDQESEPQGLKPASGWDSDGTTGSRALSQTL
jgi:hypothetical protein